MNNPPTIYEIIEFLHNLSPEDKAYLDKWIPHILNTHLHPERVKDYGNAKSLDDILAEFMTKTRNLDIPDNIARKIHNNHTKQAILRHQYQLITQKQAGIPITHNIYKPRSKYSNGGCNAYAFGSNEPYPTQKQYDKFEESIKSQHPFGLKNKKDLMHKTVIVIDKDLI